MLFAAGSVAIEGWTRRWAAVQAAIAAAAFAGGLVFLPFTMPVLSEPQMLAYSAAVTGALHIKRGSMQTERHRTSALPEDWADMHGWPELTETVARVVRRSAAVATRAGGDRREQLRRGRRHRFLRRAARPAAGALGSQQLLAVGAARLQRQRGDRRQRRLRRGGPPLSKRAPRDALRLSLEHLVRAEHPDHGLRGNQDAAPGTLAKAARLYLTRILRMRLRIGC